MRINRRGLLGGVVGAFVPRLLLAQSDSEVKLIAEASAMQLVNVKGVAKTPVWRFQKDSPIAVMRARQGEVFKGTLINRLEQEIWLHWFGVRGPAKMVTVNAPPGGTAEFEFTPPDAGTFWFGPLLHASEQRDRGLYGMLVVEEREGQDTFIDVPVIIDDWMLDDQGRMQEKFGDLDAAIGEGRVGNWFTVNGAFKSRVRIGRDKPARVRLLNAANARAVAIEIKGVPFEIMALDGEPIRPRAAELDRVSIEPGQRADLLIRQMQPFILAINLPEDVIEAAQFTTDRDGETVALPADFRLPDNPLPQVGDLSTARVVTLLIQGGAKGGLKSAKVGDEELETRKLLEKGLAWAINGIAGAGGAPLFEAKTGETLVLEIDNQTAFPQPLHIHGHVWRAIEVDGKALTDEPWRDTAVVPGQGKMKLAFVAGEAGLWPIQSLNAERCDAGLIGAFEVQEMP